MSPGDAAFEHAGVGEVGANDGRLHAADAARRQLQVERLRQSDTAVFRHAVVDEPRAAEHARDARHRHQVAVVLGDHTRQERLDRLPRGGSTNVFVICMTGRTYES